MQTKVTKKLFINKYQYKLVLVCAGASWFRGGDWAGILENLKKVVISTDTPMKGKISLQYPAWRTGIKTQEDLDYAFKLQSQLKKLSDIEVRVESPWISIYSNSKADMDSLIKLDKDRVKYISVPPDSTSLGENVVILPKIPYEYRVTVGKSTHPQHAFIEWSETTAKVKLTKSCKRELSKDRSWGGSYFYISGEKNLLVAKMHLGSVINKVERIVKG